MVYSTLKIIINKRHSIRKCNASISFVAKNLVLNFDLFLFFPAGIFEILLWERTIQQKITENDLFEQITGIWEFVRRVRLKC